jgi:hypothetical protein
MSISRRNFVRNVPLCAVLAAAGLTEGCTVTTANGVTTATLNVATVDLYAKAMTEAGTTLLSIPLISAALGPVTLAAAQIALTGISSAVAAFDTASKGLVTVTYNGTSAGAAFDSLSADAVTLLNDIKAVVATQVGTVESDITTALDSFQTVLTLTQALVATFTGTAAVVMTPMTEADALAVWHLKPLVRAN